VRRGRVLDLVLLGGSLAAFALILLVTQAIRRDVALREVAQGRVQAQAAELAAQAEQLEHQQARLEEQLEEEQTLAEELTETNSQLARPSAPRRRRWPTRGARRRATGRSWRRARRSCGARRPTAGSWPSSPGGRVHGQAWAEYRDWGWAEAIHPDDRDATVAAWEMALAGGGASRPSTGSGGATACTGA
jgi:type II secretory pathway pseudopilin PulG